MKVPGVLFSNQALLQGVSGDPSLMQLANVATLPGIERNALAMPDIHFGYGFPVGGVAAFDLAEGVVSPAGSATTSTAAYRLLRTGLTVDEVRPRLAGLVDRLYREVPSGVGSKGGRTLSAGEIDEVLAGGAAWAVGARARSAGRSRRPGGGWMPRRRAARRGQRERAPSRLAAARDPRVRQSLPRGPGRRRAVLSRVRERARARAGPRRRHAPHRLAGARAPGRDRLHPANGPAPGTGGRAARRPAALLRPGRLGRRRAVPRRDGGRGELRLGEPAGDHRRRPPLVLRGVRRGRRRRGGRGGLRHRAQHGEGRGAPDQRDLEEGPRSPEGGDARIPRGTRGGPGRVPTVRPTGPDPRRHGHRELRARGAPDLDGAVVRILLPRRGRRLSRHAAVRTFRYEEVTKALASRGILVRSASREGVTEEAPGAYKDVEEVVRVAEGAGLTRRVARLLPMAVVKG